MKLTELIDMLSGVSKNGGATGKPREISLEIKDSAGNSVMLGDRVRFEVSGTGDGTVGATVDLDLVCEDRGFLVPDSYMDVDDPERIVGKDEEQYEVMFVARWHGAGTSTTIPWNGPKIVFAHSPHEAAKKMYDELWKRFQPPKIAYEQCIVIDCQDSSTYVYRMLSETVLANEPEALMRYESPEDARSFGGGKGKDADRERP